MMKDNVPYAVINEGHLKMFKEDVPLWTIMLLARVHHFNSRRNERYTLYLDKESCKLRVRPEDIVYVIESMCNNGEITFEQVNSGLYLVNLNGELLKKMDIIA